MPRGQRGGPSWGYRRAVLSRRHAWLVAIVATLTMTVSYVDRGTLAVLAPTVSKALHLSEEDFGWLVSAFSIPRAQALG